MRSACCGALVLCLLLSSALTAGTRVTNFGSNPGNLAMYEYVPASLQSAPPLVVLLHGCTQSASDFELYSGWAELAETWGFLLVSAAQNSGNNASTCFNWFESGDISRGSGEAQSIMSMVAKMKTDYGVDDGRVYVVGFSAGGAMTAVMLATYPDVFSGGAIFSGVPYACGIGLSSGFSCMNPGSDLSPTAWADKVFSATSYSGPWPIVSIWHGDADTTVRPANQRELMEQWTAVHGTDQTADIEDTVNGIPHKVYKTAGGAVAVETYTLPGMGHAVPVDPGAGETQGGGTGAYFVDRDIWAAYHVGRFFGLDDSDAVAPTVTLTAPADQATVSGTVAVTASASDDVAVAQVGFFVDGMLVATDTSAPYGFSWQTAAEASGTHTLFARAVDTSGNTGTSATHTVTVTGGVEDVTPPTATLVFPQDGASLFGSVTLAATATDDFGVASVEFFVDGQSIGTGTPSGQAGPWQIAWNTTSVADGSHTVSVTAADAAGNQAGDGPVTVTVDQDVQVLDESFSDRDGNADALNADRTGWTTGGFAAAADNHTLGPAGSKSAYASASSGSGCAVGTQTKTLSLSCDLGEAPVLRYWRKLNLSAAVNTFTTAAFQVRVDGVTVAEQRATYATHAESAWTEDTVDLTAYAGQTVDLDFVVSAYSNVCLAVTAQAWLDDITVGTADRPDDTTPPSVALTAPSNGAVVSGTVDLSATAADASGVAKVEFYIDGNLVDVDTSAPYSVAWPSGSVPDGSHTVMVQAVDTAGNTATDNTTTVTVSNGGGTTPTTAAFAGDDGRDGYVKAYADGSGAATGSSFMESYYGLALGRGTDGKFNRTLLSFDTSALPDGAVITRAYLTVAFKSAGGDPWADPAGNTLEIDLKTGCFGGCTTETGDWAATADVVGAARLVKWTSGNQTSTDFSASALAGINKTGTTQLRLRFAQAAGATNYLFIDHGATAVLTVVY